MTKQLPQTEPVQLLNTTRAAQFLNIGSDSLRRLVKEGRIGYRKLPTGRLLFSQADLANFQNRGEYHAPTNRG